MTTPEIHLTADPALLIDPGDTPAIRSFLHHSGLADGTRYALFALRPWKDLGKARAVQKEDDTVDGLFDTVKNELVGQITEHPDLSGECLDLLMIAKYLERIGDHAVNVAEWVEYSITGAHAGE